MMNFGDRNGDRRIACKLVLGQRRWCMVSTREVRRTEIEDQGVRHRSGACCQQKLLSAMCHQETWI